MKQLIQLQSVEYSNLSKSNDMNLREDSLDVTTGLLEMEIAVACNTNPDELPYHTCISRCLEIDLTVQSYIYRNQLRFRFYVQVLNSVNLTIRLMPCSSDDQVQV